MARPKTLEPTVSRAYRVMFTHRRRGYEVGIIAAVENIEEAERAAWMMVLPSTLMQVSPNAE